YKDAQAVRRADRQVPGAAAPYGRLLHQRPGSPLDDPDGLAQDRRQGFDRAPQGSLRRQGPDRQVGQVLRPERGADARRHGRHRRALGQPLFQAADHDRPDVRQPAAPPDALQQPRHGGLALIRRNIMAYETLEVRKLTGGCGAEVLGVDLKSISNRQWDEVQAAFAEHGVIFFRDQKLTPEQHLEFARRWAPIDVNRFFKAVAGYPEIAEVRKEPEQKTNIGGGWHTDHSYDPEPAMGSILLARELPEEGGDTLFANM